MNIYKTETIGAFECRTSIELDCSKPDEVAFAREILETVAIEISCETSNPVCTKEK